jgi:hypothetical protein
VVNFYSSYLQLTADTACFGGSLRPSGVHGRGAALIGIGNLQLGCNVMKGIKEQAFAISCRDITLLLSKTGGLWTRTHVD